MKFQINPKPLAKPEPISDRLCIEISYYSKTKLNQFLTELFGPDTVGTGCKWNYLLIDRRAPGYFFRDCTYNDEEYTEITEEEALMIGDMHGYQRL